jgi:hypothetical protein
MFASFTPVGERIEDSKRSSGSLFYASGTDTRRAYTHLFPGAIHDCANIAQIRVPPSPASVVGVADHVAIVRHFAAEFTF